MPSESYHEPVCPKEWLRYSPDSLEDAVYAMKSWKLVHTYSSNVNILTNCRAKYWTGWVIGAAEQVSLLKT